MSIAEALRTPEETMPSPDRARSGSQSPFGPAPLPESLWDIRRLMSRYNPITLAEMDEVALLDRTDTKYVVSIHQLYAVLAGLPGHYRVLEVDGTRLNRYRTLYFDTNEFDLYMYHHDGRRVRYKVRSREYEDTGISFLEVKSKGKRDRTVKIRVRTEDFVTRWSPAAGALLKYDFQGDAQVLEPKVENGFCRITLVGIHSRERVTIDLGLEFRGNGRRVGLPGVAVVEVKQDGPNRDSAFIRGMRGVGLRPGGFSKYCVGVSMLYGDVKHNQFKGELRLINRLMEDNHDV